VVGLSYFSTTLTQMDFYKQTNKELMKNNELLQFVHNWAVELGMDPAHTNSTNIKQKLNKALKGTIMFEAKAKELGYSSLGNALKALSMTALKGEGSDIYKLPEVFHNVPKVWLDGRPESRGTTGFAPMKLANAQREHRRLMVYLVELWEIIDNSEKSEEEKKEGQKEVEYNYLRESADDFTKWVYSLIKKLEPIPPEEEFDKLTAPTPTLNTVDMLDDDTQALMLVMKDDAVQSGKVVSERLLQAQAVSQINNRKRRRT